MRKAMDIIVKDMDTSKREAVIAFATYKTLDKDGDRANRGMFDKSWKENFSQVRYFLNHKKDQAPGKPIRTWDDNEHAYMQVKHGTHTVGEDVLKQLDEGIIVAASYGFLPVKYKDIKGKGQDYLEVDHKEMSVLTHWGAHDDSGPVSVTKDAQAPSFKLKQLNQAEQNLLNKIIANGLDNLQEAISVAAALDAESDLYTAVMWMISRQAEMVGDVRSRLSWGTKEATQAHIVKMQKFIRNTTASDECIANVQKSLNSLLQINSDTAYTTDESAMVKCRKCGTHSVGITKDDGSIQCAECNHPIKGAITPDASRSKDALRKAAALLKLKMSMSD